MHPVQSPTDEAVKKVHLTEACLAGEIHACVHMIRYYCVRVGTGESGFAWTVRDSIRILVLIIGLQYGPDVSISDLRYTITTAIDFAM